MLKKALKETKDPLDFLITPTFDFFDELTRRESILLLFIAAAMADTFKLLPNPFPPGSSSHTLWNKVEPEPFGPYLSSHLDNLLAGTQEFIDLEFLELHNLASPPPNQHLSPTTQPTKKGQN